MVRSFFYSLKEKFGKKEYGDEEYIPVEEMAEEKARILVRPFVLEEFENIKPVLDALREGNTVALINIRPLKEKDLVDLKRAINKLRKTCDAIDGDIAGFGEEYVVAVPSFARIHRGETEKEGEGKGE